MHAVFSLVPDHRIFPVEQFRADFLAAMGRQAMHEQRVSRGMGHQFAIDLKAGEYAVAIRAFLFLAHARPDVGHYELRAAHGFGGLAHERDPAAVGRHQFRLWLETLRATDAQFEIEGRGRVDIRLADIVAVADPGHGNAGDGAAMLLPSLDVREQLAGMEIVAEGVDHRYAGICGESHQPLVIEGADGYAIDHARDHAGGVLDRLAAAELAVAGGDEQAGAVHLRHGSLECDPRAGGSLLEDQSQRLAALTDGKPGLRLERHGPLHNSLQILRGQIVQR